MADGKVVGLEVELTPKQGARLEHILRTLSAQYAATMYVYAPEARSGLETALRKMDPAQAAKFTLKPLAELAPIYSVTGR